MNKEVALGLFVSFALVVFLSFLFFLGNFTVGKYYAFDVMFTDVSGLPIKASVNMSGVKIGTVADIVLYEGEAKVTVKIKKNIEIPRDSVFSIMSTGVVGSKYLDIRPKLSHTENRSIVFIAEGDSVRGVAPFNMNQVMDQLMRVVDEFTANGDVKESPIFRTIKNLESITDKINKGLGRDEQDFREIILNIKDATKSLKNIGADVDELVKNNKGQVNDVIKNAKQISEKLNIASDKINLLLTNANEGKGTIATLINDDAMANELKETVKSVKQASEDIKNLTKKVSEIDVSWDVDMRHNNRDSETRTDFGFVIQPRSDKRYLLSVDNVATDNATKYDEGNQKYNTVTALIEKDFGQFTVHAGAMRSSGGIGGIYRPLKKVGVNVDVYRFDRENDSGKKVAWVDSSVSYQINKWTKIKVGTEDVLEKPGFTAGVNVTVLDKDISYLFGLVGFASLKK